MSSQRPSRQYNYAILGNFGKDSDGARVASKATTTFETKAYDRNVSFRVLRPLNSEGLRLEAI
jgi:hypothetical protein